MVELGSVVVQDPRVIGVLTVDRVAMIAGIGNPIVFVSWRRRELSGLGIMDTVVIAAVVDLTRAHLGDGAVAHDYSG